MASIPVRDIPPDLHQRLQDAAACHRRSLTEEVIVLLEAALRDRDTELPPPIPLTFSLTEEWLRRAISEGRE